jgi:hypothetical protein
MAVVIWALVGLFWMTVVAKHFWNKDPKRVARSKTATQTVAFKILDGIDWVWTKVLRRKSLAHLPQEQVDATVVIFLASKGIRAAYKNDENGNKVLGVHVDDREKLDALMDSYTDTHTLADDFDATMRVLSNQSDERRSTARFLSSR